jgi:hypothetical protein
LGDAGAAPGNLLLVHSACLVTPGSESRANGHEDSPENLGDPVVSIVPAGRSPAYQLEEEEEKGKG